MIGLKTSVHHPKGFAAQKLGRILLPALLGWSLLQQAAAADPL